MNKQELPRALAPLYPKRYKPDVYKDQYDLTNALGKIVVKGLTEKMAYYYSRAINSYYAPDRHEYSDIIAILDIPDTVLPKSMSNTINVSPDGTYAIEADREYKKQLRDIKINLKQYTTLRRNERVIRKKVWIEMVFHIKGRQTATLTDLCNGAADLLGYLNIVKPHNISSLNNSRILADNSTRTEIIIREFKR